MTEEKTIKKLKEVGEKQTPSGSSARMLLGIIERSTPDMKRRLLAQVGPAMSFIEQFENASKDPEFLETLMKMKGAGK
tara:strand:- start:450 stop:683 length:234 start_codon:yes stop_codon:yes gene_type:complete